MSKYVKKTQKAIYDIIYLSYLNGIVYEKTSKKAVDFADTSILHSAKQAIDFLLGRADISPAKQERLTAYLTEKSKDIAKLSYGDTMLMLNNHMSDVIKTGISIKSFEKVIKKDAIFGRVEQKKLVKNYWETVYRTNVSSAYNAGKYDQQTSNTRVKYLQYVAVGDDRTTDICLELDGTILPADDAFWDMYYPPNHFNCRSLVIAISKAKAKLRNIKTTGTPGISAAGKAQNKGFDQNPKKEWNKTTPEMKKREKQNGKELNKMAKLTPNEQIKKAREDKRKGIVNDYNLDKFVIDVKLEAKAQGVTAKAITQDAETMDNMFYEIMDGDFARLLSKSQQNDLAKRILAKIK